MPITSQKFRLPDPVKHGKLLLSKSVGVVQQSTRYVYAFCITYSSRILS